MRPARLILRLVVGVALCTAVATGEESSLSETDWKAQEQKLLRSKREEQEVEILRAEREILQLQESRQNEQRPEHREMEMTLELALERIARLQKECAKLLQQRDAYAQSLAAANVEADYYRQAYQSLRERVDIIGLEGANPERQQLEEKLLAAMREVRVLEAENESYAEQIIKLVESIITTLRGVEGIDPQKRLALETTIREVNERLGLAFRPQEIETEATLTEARIISVSSQDSSLGGKLVVANVGSSQGVMVGMPFHVMRKDRPIAQVMAIDVREKISGLLITQFVSGEETLAVGDHLRVVTRSTLETSGEPGGEPEKDN